MLSTLIRSGRLFLAGPLISLALCGSLTAADHPNILWLTAEDIGPQLGCYGDQYADTPHLDRFASRSQLYRRVWSNAPVCAPSRTTLITGVHATANGAHHMRSDVPMPAFMRMYPRILRDAGYYCSNNSKEDYNLRQPEKVWDASSRQAHWTNRAAGQPFFAIFNFDITHESQIRRRPHTLRHDPARAPLPAYHPDQPEVRQDWAQYYDNISTMDGEFAARLREIEAAGLAEDTIVFFYGDHGSGMPRSKRWPYHSGLHVPFLVHVPAKWRHLAPNDYRAGGETDRLISFVDLAPTLCSLAGIRPPAWMQGNAFMGEFAARPQSFLHGYRGRMDERLDLVRSVTDGRYVYVRNYMPHLIYGQYLDYMFQTPTTRVWKQLYDAGQLRPPQTFFWETKPPEELYDLTSDRDEVNNLVRSRAHQGILTRMRRENREHLLEIRDVGFAPEAEMHRRRGEAAPYEFARNASEYPLRRILEAAEVASSPAPQPLSKLKRNLRHDNGSIRYWGALGILMRGKESVVSAQADLARALMDASPSVRIVAAQALAQFADGPESEKALAVLRQLSDVRANEYFVCIEALNAIDALGERARSIVPSVLALPRDANVSPKLKEYLARLMERIEATARQISPAP